MDLPKINEVVTTGEAIKLCKHFGFDYLVERIGANPRGYKPWRFDGCSGLPDEILGLFTGCYWKDITYKCCLPHDLGYAYGELGNVEEKNRVDSKFHSDLISEAHMKVWLAAIFKVAVEVGGAEELGTSFSWGFANVRQPCRKIFG